MNKNQVVSALFAILAIIVMGGVYYLTINYVGEIIGALFDFVTGTDYSKIAQCGVSIPPQFDRFKADFKTGMLPLMYLGPIFVFIIIAGLMFLSGFFFHKGKHQSEEERHAQIERDLVRKMVTKVEAEKVPARPASYQPQQEEASAMDEPAAPAPAAKPPSSATRKR